MMMLQLDLREYQDRITVLNPTGNVGILTLWSRVDVVLKQIHNFGPLPSAVAAIANFYGDGLSQLLVNLAWNPQITSLYVVGSDRTNSYDELCAYFARGLEDINVNGIVQKRVVGTTRLVNQGIPQPYVLRPHGVPMIMRCQINELPRLLLAEPFGEIAADAQRVRVVLQETKLSTYPSLPVGHQVIGTDIADTWVEVLAALTRFGLDVQLKKGYRRELYNLKAVITNPTIPTPEQCADLGLNRDRLSSYMTGLLDPVLPPDISYTYGHRLRSYFGIDAIDRVISRLVADRDDRKCYITTWDQRQDLETPDDPYDLSRPCLVSLYFRIVRDRLLVSATFRTHRAYTAWIDNACAICELASDICNHVDAILGPVTIYSQSIGLESQAIEPATALVRGRKWQMRDDQRGDVVFKLERAIGDHGMIVVEHRVDGLTVDTYRGQNAEVLAHKLQVAGVVSDVGHAMYVGRQLGLLQAAIKHKVPYEEA